jgi:hypothetical protein
VVAPGCADLIEEWSVLQWDEDRLAPDARYRQHASDAALYAWRRCRHWMPADAPEEPAIEEGSHAWAEREAERMRASLRRVARARARR